MGEVVHLRERELSGKRAVRIPDIFNFRNGELSAWAEPAGFSEPAVGRGGDGDAERVQILGVAYVEKPRRGEGRGFLLCQPRIDAYKRELGIFALLRLKTASVGFICHTANAKQKQEQSYFGCKARPHCKARAVKTTWE